MCSGGQNEHARRLCIDWPGYTKIHPAQWFSPGKHIPSALGIGKQVSEGANKKATLLELWWLQGRSYPERAAPSCVITECLSNPPTSPKNRFAEGTVHTGNRLCVEGGQLKFAVMFWSAFNEGTPPNSCVFRQALDRINSMDVKPEDICAWADFNFTLWMEERG